MRGTGGREGGEGGGAGGAGGKWRRREEEGLAAKGEGRHLAQVGKALRSEVLSKRTLSCAFAAPELRYDGVMIQSLSLLPVPLKTSIVPSLPLLLHHLLERLSFSLLVDTHEPHILRLASSLGRESRASVGFADLIPRRRWCGARLAELLPARWGLFSLLRRFLRCGTSVVSSPLPPRSPTLAHLVPILHHH